MALLFPSLCSIYILLLFMLFFSGGGGAIVDVVSVVFVTSVAVKCVQAV